MEFTHTKTALRQTIAFTMIELLVVIAIIAILIALLIPALSKAKEKTRVIACIHNQKQITSGLILYANDHSGDLPPFGQYVTFDPGRWWYSLIKPYLGITNPNIRIGASYLRCPTAPSSMTSTYNVNYGYLNAPFYYEGVISAGTPLSSSKNLWKISGRTYLTADWNGRGGLYNPLGWVLNRDLDGDGQNDTSAPFVPTGGIYNYFDPRHSKTGVCGFADGSVRRVTVKDWVSNKDEMWGTPY